MIALLLVAAALAVGALLGDLQLALALALAAVSYAYADPRMRRVFLHLAINALALAALEAALPALGGAAYIAFAAVFSYTIYITYITFSYVWRVLKKYGFRGRR